MLRPDLLPLEGEKGVKGSLRTIVGAAVPPWRFRLPWLLPAL
jgi:hypothetical protein